MEQFKNIAAALCAACIIIFARFVTAVRGIYLGIEPDGTQRIYFANHCSHGDFVLLWTVLPPRIRKCTRPVAAADYWLATAVRRFIGCRVFNAILVQRDKQLRTQDPISQMTAAVMQGHSLILFPEGTRNTSDVRLLPFKSGLFHLATRCPDVEMVPVWISNLNRVLPKGEVVPVPLICTVSFGAPLMLAEYESKDEFIARAHDALLQLDSTDKAYG